MKIYHYHPEYKIYVGSSDADPSPLEPGVFLIPAHVTELGPPTCTECKVPVFNGSSWDIADDCRGTYYSTTTQEEIKHTDPLTPPENATKEQPPELPEGYVLEWDDGWVLKEIPKLTPQQILKQAGLTVEELKELLGL